ncbi:MAG: universal stress protein, partial [Merismopedia sp. SIO2A8]|nr:universal stress protein [Merismopedia sp. SIO2A8]
MFQRVLICTDLADGLQRLIHFVPSLSASGLSHITFLHTTPLLTDRGVPRPDTEQENKAKEKLSVALTHCPDGVDVQVDVQSGRPIDHILKAIKTHEPDLLVLGT